MTTREERGLAQALGLLQWALDRRAWAEAMTNEQILVVLDYAAEHDLELGYAFRRHYADSLRPAVEARFCETCGRELSPYRRKVCGNCRNATEWKQRWHRENQRYEAVADQYREAGFNRKRYVRVGERDLKAHMEHLMRHYERRAEECLENYHLCLKRGDGFGDVVCYVNRDTVRKWLNEVGIPHADEPAGQGA